MITKSSIDNFLSQKHIAVAGVSGKNNKKFGNLVFNELKKKGYHVYAVNPNSETVEGEKCYPDIQSLPYEVSALHINTPKAHTVKVIQDALEKGISHIWIQQMAETPEVIEMAKSSTANLIYKKCIMMFANPSGIHSFHKGITKLFGKYPK